MKAVKKLLLKLLFPPAAVVILLAAAASAGLVYTFGFEGVPPYAAVGCYVLSAYALVVVCAALPRFLRWTRRVRTENRWVSRYLTDSRLRVEMSLYNSLAINSLYALLQVFSGLRGGSRWYFALAGYYVLLAVVRFFLLRDARRGELGADLLREYRRYRFCGVVLLLVNLALGVIVAFIVWQDRGFRHGEIVTIAMAAYTFYSVTVSVIEVLKNRRHESPVRLAARSISLTAALVSLLSLETAMLSAFGAGQDQFRRVVTAATGMVICLLVLWMAVYMIRRGSREIKKLTKEYHDHE